PALTGSNDPATLSAAVLTGLLRDSLRFPGLVVTDAQTGEAQRVAQQPGKHGCRQRRDRKSTRLNSSHVSISYAGFCLKKKNSSISSSSQFILLAGPCNRCTLSLYSSLRISRTTQLLNGNATHTTSFRISNECLRRPLF